MTAGAIVEPCDDGSCPVARAVAVLDGKWTMLVVRDLLAGPRRFGQLRTSLAGVSPKTLTDRLRELEEAGLVTRTHFPEIPPRVEYALTAQGLGLGPVVAALADFGRGLPGVTASGSPGRARASLPGRRDATRR